MVFVSTHLYIWLIVRYRSYKGLTLFSAPNNQIRIFVRYRSYKGLTLDKYLVYLRHRRCLPVRYRSYKGLTLNQFIKFLISYITFS